MGNTVQIRLIQISGGIDLPWVETPRFKVDVDVVGSDLSYGLSGPLPKENAIGALNHMLTITKDSENYTTPCEIDE